MHLHNDVVSEDGQGECKGHKPSPEDRRAKCNKQEETQSVNSRGGMEENEGESHVGNGDSVSAWLYIHWSEILTGNFGSAIPSHIPKHGAIQIIPSSIRVVFLYVRRQESTPNG
jgi:hypothetical protein